ncbi:hypothetical protein BpHYR1_054430 [Brachionus plicatilis]|uniref:Uncharacterized protein n=1 Tax=Brachionus plicatilis TaxID=10195 RepID=A0A3M7QIA1_BRAPC|nr:hypothetical protein BpHYR1_054430 [Brachionus plicatilis]
MKKIKLKKSNFKINHILTMRKTSGDVLRIVNICQYIFIVNILCVKRLATGLGRSPGLGISVEQKE